MMYSLFVFSLLGSTWAASSYRQRVQSDSFLMSHDLKNMNQELNENLSQMTRHLEQTNHKLEKILSQMSHDFVQINQELKKSWTRYFNGIQSHVIDGRYVITISLPGFKKGDITVKIEGKRLSVVATSRDINNNSFYMHYTELPFYAGNNGIWTYDGQILSIVFPLNEPTTSVAPTALLNVKESVLQVPEIKNSRPSVHNTAHAVEV